MIGYLDEVIRPLILILPKMSGYFKTFKEKNYKLMPLRINDDKILEKYKISPTKIEDLKNVELNTLPVRNDRYIKTKIRIYGDNVCTNFCGLNVPGAILLQSFPLIFYLFMRSHFIYKYL